VQNQGLEFTLGVDVVKNKRFSWNSSFNISFNQNKVLELTDNQEYWPSTVSFGTYRDPNFIAKLGQPLGLFYGYISDGTYKYADFDKSGSGGYVLKPDVPDNGNLRTNIKPGMEKYRDINHDGTINALDRTIIGNGNPIHTGGWNNNFVFGNFDMNLFFQWSYGNEVFNANRLVMEGTTRFDTNQFATYVNRWSPQNPDSNMPIGTQTPYNSRVIEDGSFIRLKTAQIGYTIPKKIVKKFKINNLRMYAAAQNIFTLTKYSGSDPEVSVRNSALTPGFDYSSYPRAFIVTFGLTTNF
jgi:hypothetical protein